MGWVLLCENFLRTQCATPKKIGTRKLMVNIVSGAEGAYLSKGECVVKFKVSLQKKEIINILYIDLTAKIYWLVKSLYIASRYCFFFLQIFNF